MKKILIVLFSICLTNAMAFAQTKYSYYPNKMSLMNMLSGTITKETNTPVGTITITRQGDSFSIKMLNENTRSYTCKLKEHNTTEGYQLYEGTAIGTNKKVQFRIDNDVYFVMITFYVMGDTDGLIYYILKSDISIN